MQTVEYPATAQLSETLRQLSEAQRIQFNNSLGCVTQWMEDEAPPSRWPATRPAMEIVLNVFLKATAIDPERLKTLVLLKYELLQPKPDSLFMRHLWYSL